MHGWAHVDFYINIANDFNNKIGSKTNLFNQVLRLPIKKIGGKLVKRDCRPKNGLSRLFTPVGKYGPAEI